MPKPIVDPLILRKHALAMMCISSAGACRRRKWDATFPETVRIGGRQTAMRASAVQAWIDSLPVGAPAPPHVAIAASLAARATRKHG